MPKMYARGILFGKMVLELGDMCYAKNEKTGMSCDIEFKTKVSKLSHCSHRSIYSSKVGMIRDSSLAHTTQSAARCARMALK
jgi:hypothetical protein